MLFCFYSFCAALTDGTVCSMRMFIYFRSFWTPYSLFDLQVVHCTTHCNPHCIAIPAYRLWMLVECCFQFCFIFYVFVIRSCAISLYFISLQIRLCFIFYVFMFIFIFHHWLSLLVRLTHLYWNKRAQLMVCLDFFCSQFHLSVYSIQYAFSVLVLNVLSPVSRLYV